MITAVNEFLDDLRGGRMTEVPVVRVEQGQLQGRLVNGPTGKAFYSFQGIPYAKPPLGSLRFKAPQPPEPWDGVRDATSEGNISAQINPVDGKGFVGDENCLFLNVYTPNLDGEFLPVMVYIHGGGFNFGSGNSSDYGADYLVEKDVVVVTINYRCGALGFLSLNTPDVPGNAGLKDMVQAIRWVKENVKNFGGNSGNLTIFGESAGGASVALLTASPMSKDLMSKGIIQSGTPLCSWTLQRTPIENARTLANNLGCESSDIEEILEFLSTTPAKDLVEATSKLSDNLFVEKGLNFFAPVVEKEFSCVEPFLSESFINILTSGRVADVPIMIGTTTLEIAMERKTDDLQSFIPDDLNLEWNSEESLAVAEKIKKIYFKGPHIGVESLMGRFQLLSDILFNIDTHRYVQYLVQTTNKPIYYYKFDYVGELNLLKHMVKHMLGNVVMEQAGHMDELGYLFKNDYLKDVEPTPRDVKMRERMVRMWTNFAKMGNPTPDETHYLPITWQPVTRDNLYYMNLGTELSLGTSPDKEKMEFWDELYSKYYKIWDHPKTNEEVTRVTESIIITDSTPIIVQETTESVIITDSTPIIVRETIIETVMRSEFNEDVQIKEENSIVKDEIQQIEHNEPIVPISEPIVPKSEPIVPKSEQNGSVQYNGEKKARTSNEIKMVQNNGHPKDVIRANDPPEDDLPKNIGVNKFVNFFESLGGKK